MNKHLKHLLLTMCIFVFGFALTGCGVATTTSVKISSATKASCTVSIGFDDEMIESMASLSNTTKQAIIKDAKKSGLKYSKKRINGTIYHMFVGKLDIENPIIRINTAFKGCSSLEKISVLPRIYHN